jgi:surface polysaccharide O-acyltransferase-like enzyme
MISGALLLEHKDGFTEFIKKRASKILLPFAFFSLIYLSINLVNDLSNPDLSYFGLFKKSIISLVNGSYYHLWFIYALFGIYLFIPFIGEGIRTANKKELAFFIALWFIALFKTGSLAPYIVKLDLTNFSGFLGYAVLGYFLKKYSSSFTSSRILMFFLLAINISIIILSIDYYRIQDLNINYNPLYTKIGYLSTTISGGYLSFNTALISIALFSLFKSRNLDITKYTILKHFDNYSYGIYLIHPISIMLINYLGLTTFLNNPLLSIPINTVICFILSYIFIKYLGKINYLKPLMGLSK